MFKTSKEISVVALFSAMLIGVQYALSGIHGVELVTVFLLCFSYAFGARRGAIAALAFALLRNLVFGFFPTVVILYCVYYPCFALLCGTLGGLLERGVRNRILKTVIMVACAVVMTVFFTLLDDVITPLFYGFTRDATVAYFYQALPIMSMQCVSVAVSVSCLFLPLSAVFIRLKRSIFGVEKEPSAQTNEE